METMRRRVWEEDMEVAREREKENSVGKWIEGKVKR